MIALFAALIAPWFIDWTAYRTAFEREATKVIGQPVRVAGTASVRILPLPSVTFTDLTVGENADGTPMMTVDSFSLNAELMPFLSGEVRIIEMVLERPAITVAVDEGGSVAWTARQELLVDPEKVKLDNLRIENGSFRIEGLAGGRTIEGKAISAAIRARSLVGPWYIEANGEFDGHDGAVSITTGRLQEEGAIRVRAASRRGGEPYRLILDGPLSVKEGVLAWDGQFEVSPASEPAVPAEGLLPEALDVRAAGRFMATPEAAEIPEYRLEIGSRDDPYTVTGAGRVNVREDVFFQVTADGRQIDLDRLEGAQGGTQGAASLDSRIAALRRIVNRIPVPQARGEIDVLLPAIVAGDTVIREVKATVEPDGNGWRVATFKAALPGNTLVEARGRLGTGADFGFSGHMLLASRQPTGFAAWLAGKSNAALRRLSTAGFSADVTLSGRQASFENLELILNEAILKGKLQRLAPVDGRPGIVADLKGERINTDDLFAVYSLTEKDEGPALTNHDLDISLSAGVLEGMGVVARNVDAHVRVEAGSVSVDRLNAGDFYGARIASSGRLADLTAKPSGRFALSVEAQDGGDLAEFARQHLGENRFLAALAGDRELSRDLSVKIEVEARPQGDISKGTLTASGWAGGTAFAVRDRFEGQPARWKEAIHDFSARFEQAEPGILARQFALPVTPIAADGPVTVTAELSGNPRDGLKANFAANAPGTDLSASGNLAFQETAATGGGEEWLAGEPEFDLDVTLGSKDIDPWLIMAGYPLPGTGEGHPASLTFAVNGKNGVYTLENLSGTHGGNRFSGGLVLDTGHGERPKAKGQLSFDTVSVPFAAELLLGPGTIAGDGLSGQAGDAEFGVPLLSGVDAEFTLKADEVDFGGGPRGKALSGDALFIDGTLSLPQFSAGWLGGTISGNLSLKNANRNAILNTQTSLSGVDAGKLIGLAGFAPALAGKADIGVTLDAGGRSLDGLVSALSGSGVFSLDDSAIEGISTGNLDRILAEADREDFEINAGTVAPLARDAILTGRFGAGAFSGAFTIAQGRVSVRNIQLADQTGTLAAGGSFEPASGKTDIGVTVKLNPGKEALAGADPAVDLTWSGRPGTLSLDLGTRALEGYLSLRAFEREQRKVELLQESVLEKQRLRRETVLTNARMAYREKQRLEELRRLEELQRRMEEERKAREEAQKREAGEGARTEPGVGVPDSVNPDSVNPDSASPDNASPEKASADRRGEAPQAALPEAAAAPVVPPAPTPAPNSTDTEAATAAPIPLPAPRQGAAGSALPGKKGIVTRPLPPPKQDGFTLFEDIRRKLFGE